GLTARTGSRPSGSCERRPGNPLDGFSGARTPGALTWAKWMRFLFAWRRKTPTYSSGQSSSSNVRISQGEIAMSATGLKAFDSTLQLTHAWLNELSQQFACQD